MFESAIYYTFTCFFIFFALSFFKKSNIMHYDELANIIRDRREVLKITQEHLAELSGIGLRTLKSIETGKGNPTLETIIKIIEILGLELNISVKKIKL